MIALPLGTKVFLACQPIDLRAGFDGLAAKVQQIIGAARNRLRSRVSLPSPTHLYVESRREAQEEDALSHLQ
jgi:hypothetical protein